MSNDFSADHSQPKKKDKTDQLTKFYGAAECAHTKTMTKETLFPEIDGKTSLPDEPVIKEENDEEESMEEKQSVNHGHREERSLKKTS